jgi:hypothetical protein
MMSISNVLVANSAEAISDAGLEHQGIKQPSSQILVQQVHRDDEMGKAIKRQKRQQVGSACPPCAKAKAACDNERPCRRCVRRNKSSLCFSGMPSIQPIGEGTEQIQPLGQLPIQISQDHQGGAHIEGGIKALDSEEAQGIYMLGKMASVPPGVMMQQTTKRRQLGKGKACVNCTRSKAACDEARPCTRCVRLDKKCEPKPVQAQAGARPVQGGMPMIHVEQQELGLSTDGVQPVHSQQFQQQLQSIQQQASHLHQVHMLPPHSQQDHVLLHHHQQHQQQLQLPMHHPQHVLAYMYDNTDQARAHVQSIPPLSAGHAHGHGPAGTNHTSEDNDKNNTRWQDSGAGTAVASPTRMDTYGPTRMDRMYESTAPDRMYDSVGAFSSVGIFIFGTYM